MWWHLQIGRSEYIKIVSWIGLCLHSDRNTVLCFSIDLEIVTLQHKIRYVVIGLRGLLDVHFEASIHDIRYEQIVLVDNQRKIFSNR